MSWEIGHYEQLATGLVDAAAAVVAAAKLTGDDSVVDLGCGTGNAALLAAASGARVVGIDPGLRLLDVARETAKNRGLTVEFREGSAEKLPLADASADVVLSVFGLIFARDVPAAARELARVIRPGGRITNAAWLPTGPLAALGGLRRSAFPPPPGATPPFAWYDLEAVRGLFGPLGFAATQTEHALTFRAASPSAFLDAELVNHPLWLAAEPALRQAARWEAIRRDALAILVAANEDPTALALTSRFTITALTHAAPRREG
jgi:SAM-dependent methyltransferase